MTQYGHTYHTAEVDENGPNGKEEKEEKKKGRRNGDTYIPIEVSESRGHNSRRSDKWRVPGPDVNRGQR
jgi:hypothetical protein